MSDIPRERLFSQGIAHPASATAEGVVTWLGAVQAQDYAAAKWALGLRMQTAHDHAVERAFAGGAILRTHVLRPTWHFVTPKDIRWMLALTAPRIHAGSAARHRQLGLDDGLFRRAEAVLAKALRGRYLTRGELRDVLRGAGIAVDDGIRMGHVMMHAELEAVVCSGPRRGNQFTYALLDERAPRARALPRDEALARLADRYFTSRGPATVRDFAKWSGLTVGEATRGLEAVKRQFEHEVVGGCSYWRCPSSPAADRRPPAAHLLPIYDEYVSSYADRSAMVGPRYAARLDEIGYGLGPNVVVDGRIVGVWRRTLTAGAVAIETESFTRLGRAAWQSIAAAADRYGAFLGVPAVVHRRTRRRRNV